MAKGLTKHAKSIYGRRDRIIYELIPVLKSVNQKTFLNTVKKMIKLYLFYLMKQTGSDRVELPRCLESRSKLLFLIKPISAER